MPILTRWLGWAALCGVLLAVRTVAGQAPPAGHGPGDHPASPDAPATTFTPQQHEAFARQVRLDRFRLLAVFDERAKIVDTLAREQLQRIYGKPAWRDLGGRNPRYDPVFTWLDLLFNREYYADKPLIYVDVLPLRELLLRSLELGPEQVEAWKRRGRLTPRMLEDPRLARALRDTAGEAVLARARNQFADAWNGYFSLGDQLRLVSPPPGSDQWLQLLQLLPAQMTLAGRAEPQTPATVDPRLAGAVLEQFGLLREAWRQADAPAVNAALARLADLLPGIHPATYPPAWVRQTEYAYNVTGRLTIGLWLYALAAVVMMIALALGRRWLAGLGAGLLGAGLLIHTASILIRGLLSGRWWTLHNQYESFITLTWFGVVVGLALLLVRRQGIFGVAAAALGCAALSVAALFDIPSSNIARVAPILDTSRILWAHVNFVIASYGLIGLGFLTSLVYLAVHYLPHPAVLRPAAAAVGSPGLAVGAAAGIEPARRGVLNGLDRVQMVILQLAFWILGVGVLLGAYWADHAWGRFWGWDPKETWALITWIVYLIVIHVRYGVRDRGLATAWLSVLGFFVMLWTYWGVNLVLAGLHSYA